jgi:mycothiol synthase
MIAVRPVARDGELELWAGVKTAVEPYDPLTADQLRRSLAASPERVLVLAVIDGETVGAGLADRSDDPRRAFVLPRVLERHRGRGVGTALLRPLVEHAETLGVGVVGTRVAGTDRRSLAFAERFGFREVNREVEQVRDVRDDRRPEVPDGLDVVSIAARPELLRAAHDLAAEAYLDLAVPGTIEIPLERWLVEEATRPEGSFVALADAEIVGYAGLLEVGDETDLAEHGLTAVRRSWRRRGIATLLKRTQLAWAAEAGVRRLVTWTQRGNEGMRAVNERLGYVTTSETLALHADLPLTRLQRQ